MIMTTVIDNGENTHPCDKLGQQYWTWSIDLLFSNDHSVNNYINIILEGTYVLFPE